MDFLENFLHFHFKCLKCTSSRTNAPTGHSTSDMMVQEALECEQMEIWLQSLSEHADPFELYPIMFKNNNVSGGDNTEECAINTNKQKKIILNMEICEPTFRSVEVKDDHAKPVLAYMHSFEVGPRQVEGKVCRFSVEPVPLLSHRTRFIRIVSPREIEFGYIGLFSLHFHLPRRLHLDPCVQITLPETLKPTTESINLVQINRNFVIGKISQLDRTVCRSLEPSAFELLEDSPIDNLNNLYNDINSHVISTKQTISKILHENSNQNNSEDMGRRLDDLRNEMIKLYDAYIELL